MSHLKSMKVSDAAKQHIYGNAECDELTPVDVKNNSFISVLDSTLGHTSEEEYTKENDDDGSYTTLESIQSESNQSQESMASIYEIEVVNEEFDCPMCRFLDPSLPDFPSIHNTVMSFLDQVCPDMRLSCFVFRPMCSAPSGVQGACCEMSPRAVTIKGLLKHGSENGSCKDVGESPKNGFKMTVHRDRLYSQVTPGLYRGMEFKAYDIANLGPAFVQNKANNLDCGLTAELNRLNLQARDIANHNSDCVQAKSGEKS